MQPIAATVMALLLAHLIADFPLQPDWIIGKKGRNLLPLLLHGAVHYALVWICLIFCGPVRFLSIRVPVKYSCAINEADTSRNAGPLVCVGCRTEQQGEYHACLDGKWFQADKRGHLAPARSPQPAWSH
jgi:hypothetical protein